MTLERYRFSSLHSTIGMTIIQMARWKVHSTIAMFAMFLHDVALFDRFPLH
jgi:hypothetical protein